MSHTVTTSVSFRDTGVLSRAVQQMGGEVLGEGEHRLFAGPETGFGFKLSSWHFPIVLTASGQLKYDDYSGAWGNVKDLDALKELYAVEIAAAHCDELGWQYERTPSGLEIYHPDGGSILVEQNGTVDAINFTGANCQAAVEEIAKVLGETVSSSCKTQMGQVTQVNTVQEV